MDEQKRKLFATIVDSCVGGKLTVDDMSCIMSDIKTKNSISGWYAKNAFHDLATIRYRFTLEVLASTIIYMLTRPRPTIKKAISNFEKAKEILEMIILETKDMARKEERQRKKRSKRPKPPQSDQTEDEKGE